MSRNRQSSANIQDYLDCGPVKVSIRNSRIRYLENWEFNPPSGGGMFPVPPDDLANAAILYCRDNFPIGFCIRPAEGGEFFPLGETGPFRVLVTYRTCRSDVQIVITPRSDDQRKAWNILQAAGFQPRN